MTIASTTAPTAAPADPPRIPPLEPPYSAAVQAALDRIMPPGMPPLALFRTLAVNERVFLRMMAGGLLDRGSISMRERELVIDRTCWRCGAEYEWGVHVTQFGPRIALTEAEIAALCSDEPPPGCFTEREHLLLRMCDQLHATARIDEPLWSALRAIWQPDQLVELVVLAGLYHAIAFAVNAFQIPLEPFARRFPAP
jgi:alkylhydroperoxidase family enzyme